MESWRQIGLDPWVVNLCEKIGFKSPTEIQLKAIPKIIKSESVLRKNFC